MARSRSEVKEIIAEAAISGGLAVYVNKNVSKDGRTTYGINLVAAGKTPWQVKLTGFVNPPAKPEPKTTTGGTTELVLSGHGLHYEEATSNGNSSSSSSDSSTPTAPPADQNLPF